MEMKCFVNWSEDNSVMMDVKTMSCPDGPVRNAMVTSAIIRH